MKKNKSMILVLALAAMLVVPNLVVQAAQVDSSSIMNQLNQKNISRLEKFKQDKDFKIVSSDENGNYSIAPADNTKDKKEYLSKLNGYAAQGTYTTAISAPSGIDYYNGASCTNTFNSTVSVNGGLNYTVAVTGTSQCFWNGSSPYNVDSITDTDTFQWKWVGGSASISVPLGVGGSVSPVTGGKQVVYPVLNNNYAYYHSYNNISCTASAIYNYTQSKSTIFQFGNYTANPNTSISITIW